MLTVDGERINALSRDDMTYFETRFFLVPGAASHYVDADVSIIRHRSVHDCFHEKLTVLNHSSQPAEFTVRMEIGSDFADISEVGDPPERAVQVDVDSARHRLVLRYQRQRFVRETTVSSTAAVDVDEQGMTFRIRIAPEGQWETDLHVAMTIRGEADQDMRASLQAHQSAVRTTMRDDLAAWLDRAPQLVAERDGLEATYRGSLADLAALRYRPLSTASGCRSVACPGRWRCAAGTASSPAWRRWPSPRS